MAPSARLRDLLQRVEDRARGGSAEARRAVATGWSVIDRRLFVSSERTPGISSEGGLARGALHEWIGVAGAERDPARAPDWSPPLLVATHLARRAVAEALERSALRRTEAAHVVWIGRNAWPYPDALERQVTVDECSTSRPNESPEGGELDVVLGLEPGTVRANERSTSLLERSLFVDAKDPGARLWAIDTALRCASVTAVIADGSDLAMAATRRLQLAARETGALVLCLRPLRERNVVSAATTRWHVAREPGLDGRDPRWGPRWRVTLLRAKGTQELCRSA